MNNQIQMFEHPRFPDDERIPTPAEFKHLQPVIARGLTYTAPGLVQFRLGDKPDTYVVSHKTADLPKDFPVKVPGDIWQLVEYHKSRLTPSR